MSFYHKLCYYAERHAVLSRQLTGVMFHRPPVAFWSWAAQIIKPVVVNKRPIGLGGAVARGKYDRQHVVRAT
jgi:hypothetical protein